MDSSNDKRKGRRCLIFKLCKKAYHAQGIGEGMPNGTARMQRQALERWINYVSIDQSEVTSSGKEGRHRQCIRTVCEQMQ